MAAIRRQRCAWQSVAADKPSSIEVDSAARTTRDELLEVAEPLVLSGAFQRLGAVTFLGILSPRFSSPGPGVATDGTRADHSLGVARVMIDCVRHLGLPRAIERYAAAWGLLHDVATWPLSHTSEPAFARITGVDSRTLRRMMILGDRRLPARLCVTRELRSMGVAPDRLLLLFEREEPQDASTRWLWQILRSRITPDTLEGIRRAGRAYGVDVPPPESVWTALSRLLLDVTVDPRHWSSIAAFWSAKGRVYEQHINSPDAIQRESQWARAIEVAFPRTTLAASLALAEEDVIAKVGQLELPHVAYSYRYKPPQVYFVVRSPLPAVRGDLRLACLDGLLARRDLHSNRGEQWVTAT